MNLRMWVTNFDAELNPRSMRRNGRDERLARPRGGVQGPDVRKPRPSDKSTRRTRNPEKLDAPKPGVALRPGSDCCARIRWTGHGAVPYPDPMPENSDNHCHPVINVEETIGKTVGRTVSPDPSKIQEIGRRIFRLRGFQVCPRGVHRFNSHEEADEWMMRMAVKRAIKAENQTN